LAVELSEKEGMANSVDENDSNISCEKLIE